MDVITKCLIGVATLLLIAVIMLISVVISEIKERKGMRKEIDMAWRKVEKLQSELRQNSQMAQDEIKKIKSDYEGIILTKDVEISELSKAIERRKKASEKRRAEAISQALKKRKEQQKETNESENKVSAVVEQEIKGEPKEVVVQAVENTRDKEPVMTEIKKPKITKIEKVVSKTTKEASSEVAEQPKENKKRKKK